MLLDTCWKLCIEGKAGRQSIQNMEETLCQRNCAQKLNIYAQAYSVNNSAAEYHANKVEAQAAKDNKELFSDPWQKKASKAYDVIAKAERSTV